MLRSTGQASGSSPKSPTNTQIEKVELNANLEGRERKHVETVLENTVMSIEYDSLFNYIVELPVSIRTIDDDMVR